MISNIDKYMTDSKKSKFVPFPFSFVDNLQKYLIDGAVQEVLLYKYTFVSTNFCTLYTCI